jgi:3-oxoacyl-[acyl-carrier protein] reductase
MNNSINTDEHPGIGKGYGRLDGQVAVVTGANSGIGRATALLFAREGAKVICVDIAESGNKRIDKLIEQDGGKAVFVKADVTRRSDCDTMVTAALDYFGDLNILFNHVGGAIVGKIDELSEEDWNAVLNRNLNSVFHGVRAALPHFKRRATGVIVNTASTYGLLATERQPAYCASKAAVVVLTRQLAIDLAPNIRVNCICPGATATPLILRKIGASADPAIERERLESLNRCMKRLAQPEEVAFGVLFLASRESSFVTGHALVIDGGQTIDA